MANNTINVVDGEYYTNVTSVDDMRDRDRDEYDDIYYNATVSTLNSDAASYISIEDSGSQYVNV